MKTLTTTIDDLLNGIDSEYKRLQYSSMDREKIVRRAKRGYLLRKFVEIMRGKELTIEWINDQYLLRISGDYNPRVRLAYRLAENPRCGYGELRPFFGPEIAISSPNASVVTDGGNEYTYCGYIPGDGFSKPVGGSPDYCRRSSLTWNWIKNQWGAGITGWTMIIHRPIGVSLRKVPDEEVKMLTKYF